MLAAGVAVVAVLVVAVIFIEPIMARIFSSREAAMLGRAEYLRDARGMIDAKPWFGWGLNSYVFAVPPFTQYGARFARVHYQDWIPPVHNIYYLWWAELGIVGLSLQLIWLAGVISTGIKNLRVKNEMLFAINAACLAGMLAFVVDGFFSFSLRFNSILRVFWVQAGMMMAIRYYHLKSSAEERSESIGQE
jgi:O-antigen ligase